jgi:hypothetical protein
VKALQLILGALILLVGIAMRVDGLDRSLWLDEAWVANSLLEPSITEMLYYERWLQTTPPGFLLLARVATKLFGVSNVAFRLAPAMLAVWSLIAMWLALRAFVPTRRFFVAPVALAAFAFAPQAIEYGRVLKQYSGDVAVAATLIYIALRRRDWLLFAVPLAPFFSYPAIFLAPGLILLAPRKLWTAISTACAACLIYFVFMQPNQSEALRTHWRLEFHGLRRLSELLPLHPVLLVFLGMSLFVFRRRLRLALCLTVLPLLFTAAADRLGFYPIVPRTSLFLLPSLTLAFAGSLWAILLRWRKAMNPLLLAGCLLIAVFGFRSAPPVQSVEQLDEAVTEVYSRYGPDDTIYVHASVAEGFRLYSRVRGLEAKKLIWGSTSAACCPRGLPHPRGRTDAKRVEEDVSRLFPEPLQGRVWLLWTGRPEHWRWIGFDDRPFLEEFLEKRGCTKKPTIPLESVGLLLFACGV